VEDEEKYNQFNEVPFFVDTTRINFIETKISYSNVIPYACTDGEGKLVHYSSSVGVSYPGYRGPLVMAQNSGYDMFPPIANG
jgi:hypothetical protein